jgi:PAS domain S-box-containing protein
VETSFKYVKGFINDHTEVLICIFRDITDRKKIEQALEYRETLLIASSSATNCLLSGKTENSIFKALKMICTAARADRIYIFENTNLSASKKPTMSLRYEWNSGNSNSNIDSKDLQNVPYKPNFSRWHRRFNAQKIVKGIVSKFPAVEKTFLENRGVASVLLSPIYSNKKLWGFIGFDDFKQERRWSESEISILTTIGNAFGASIRRIRMEDSLRESEKRFRIIADSAPVMIWLRDSNFKLKYSNKQSCDFTGKKLENSQDDVWKKRIHPDDYQKIWKIVQNAVKTKRKFKLEYRVKRKDGKYRWVLDYGLPRCLFDGEFAGYAGACVDITERKIMEDMLKGSEQKLQMSLDAASTGIWEWDSVNNSLHCDKRISAIFGYPAKELDISMTELSERIHEKDFSILKGKLKKALNTGTLFEQDIRIKAKSGEWKFAHLRGKPNLLEVNKSQEKAAKLLGALHDISEQKSAEMILEETETRYKELFNSMNSGVAVYLPTDDLQDFIIKDMNSAGLKICKISSKNDLLDKKITQEFPSVKEMGLFKVMQKVAKTGRTQRLLGAIYSDQKINACFENVVYKLPDGKIVTVFDDVTEKRLFEEKLAKNERKYRTVLKSANDAIFILDAASKIVLDCNTKAGKILKLGKKEITGFKVFNLHLEEERKIIEGFLHEIEKKGFKNNFECNLMDSKKNALPVEISGNFLKLDGQGLIIEIARDISERKKIESMQKDLDRIAKHDLKSPLNFIINAPEILKNEINGLSQQQLKILQMIEDSAKKMFNTINLSLEMYKIEHGNLKPDLDKVDLCAIIETIEDEQEKLLKDKSANLKVIVNGRPKTKETEFIVKADEFLFYSMLSNLIKNALERTPTGKNVTVRLDKKEKKVFIKINNLGTPPDNIKDRFFEKYSSSGKKGGIGLGTYSAKLVALAHKGKINVASSEKQGTTVSIEIPI